MPATRMLPVVNALSVARDLQTVTGIVRSAARELTRADGVTFVLRDRDECYYLDEDAVAPLWKGRRFPLQACISGWVMLHGEPVVLPDIYADPRIPCDAYRPTFVKSLAMVPVRTSDPIAAIGAYWASAHHATKQELDLLSSLADSTGLALTNVRLFSELRDSLAREHEARLAAETATSAKDDFLALVVHELRQPLHASLAAVRLMAAGSSREQGRRARVVVERQLQQMNRLVEDLLDAARIVRGHIELQAQDVDLRRTIHHAIEAVRPMMSERAHDFAVTIPDHHVVLRGDEVRLQQVLMNLLSNAAKYTDPGGRIALTLVSEAAEAVITVTDTGRGIEPVLLPRIFEPFTRGAGDASGFGVGLAVSRKLVELHGGTIEARSAGVGRGSEFTVRVPVSASSPDVT